MKNNLVLISSVKDEEKSIERVYRAVMNQTIKPQLWYIIDDGSTDNTSKILHKISKKNDAIIIKKNRPSKRDISEKLCRNVKKAAERVIKESKIRGKKIDYIGVLDGDIIPDRKYYETLINEFKKKHRLGIAGGVIFLNSKSKKTKEVRDLNQPRGGNLLIRRECFSQIGGIPSSKYAWETVLNATARMNRWQTRVFENAKTIQTRPTSSAEGLLKGYWINGKSAHYLDYHPFFVFVKSIKYSVEKPHYIGIPYLAGYLFDMIRAEKKHPSKKMTDFLRNEKMRNKLAIWKNKS